MSFDEQLQHAFDTLTDRLRDDIARQVRAVMDELAEAARTDRDRAADAAARSAADAARTAADAAVAAARADLQNADLTGRGRLCDAIRAIDCGRSRTMAASGRPRRPARYAAAAGESPCASRSADRLSRGCTPMKVPRTIRPPRSRPDGKRRSRFWRGTLRGRSRRSPHSRRRGR